MIANYLLPVFSDIWIRFADNELGLVLLQSGVEGGLGQLKAWILGILNILIGIAAIFYIFRIVNKFMQSDPSATKELILLIVGLIFWYGGVNYMLDEIQNFF